MKIICLKFQSYPKIWKKRRPFSFTGRARQVEAPPPPPPSSSSSSSSSQVLGPTLIIGHTNYIGNASTACHCVEQWTTHTFSLPSIKPRHSAFVIGPLRPSPAALTHYMSPAAREKVRRADLSCNFIIQSKANLFSPLVTLVIFFFISFREVFASSMTLISFHAKRSLLIRYFVSYSAWSFIFSRL